MLAKQTAKQMAKKTALLMFSIVALAGCQKKEGSESVALRGTGPRTAVNQANSAANSTQLRGIVFADAAYQQQFQESVVGFLSTDVRPEYIGQVSATGAQNSGVRFGGRVQLTSGSLRSMGSGYGSISSASQLVIQVYDYSPQYTNAPLIPPFKFSSASGSISGNRAEISFADTYGSVTLSGTLNTQSNMFEGEISYDNNIKLDGSRPGAAGTLGNFRIAICEFFVCN